MYFVIPLAFFGIAFYWLFVGRFQTSDPTPANLQQTPVVKSAMAAPLLGGSPAPGAPFSGSQINLGGNFGSGSSSAVPHQASLSAGDRVPAVPCFANVDTRSIYSNTVVLGNGLFLADKSTRVLGGMIYNERFGWYARKDFTCTGDLATIEVEFVAPLPTPTKTVYSTPRPRTAVPSPSPVPTITNTPLPSGIVIWSVNSCIVEWQVNDVMAVYLNYPGNYHTAVVGEVNGGPVIKNLCPITGTVGIDVYKRDGSRDSRVGTLNP